MLKVRTATSGGRKRTLKISFLLEFGGSQERLISARQELLEQDGDRERLERQLASIDRDIDDHASRWNIGIGPVRLSRSVGTQTFARTFVSVNLLLWITGAVFILVGGNLKELGTAIVVGATFSFSAFLTEVWSQGMNRQAEANKSNLSRLNEQRNAILRNLEQVKDTTDDPHPDRDEDQPR